ENRSGLLAFAPGCIDFDPSLRFVELDRRELQARDRTIYDSARADKDGLAGCDHYCSGFLMRFDVGDREPRCESVSTVQANHFVIEAGGKIAVEEDEGLACDVTELYESALGQPMRFGEDDDEFLFEQQFAVEIYLIHWGSQESHIDHALEEGLVLMAGENV